MDMAERIQYLRKSKGISQEQLAETLGISRQAVSKWESGQSSPDIEKLIAMSELFDTTTDYMLKGTEQKDEPQQDSRGLAGKILRILSTTMIAIGLFLAFAGWYEYQTMGVIWGAMAIQALGLAAYFIGGLLCGESPPFMLRWLNWLGLSFMPMSMLLGLMCSLLFRSGWISPYPVGLLQKILFPPLFCLFAALSYKRLKKERRDENKG